MNLPPDFDLAIAKEAAALVKQAYNQYNLWKSRQPWNIEGDYDEPVLMSARPEGIFDGVLERVEPFGFVTHNKTTGTVFVVYRGTQSPGDWISNMKFPQVPFKEGWGKVEEGFSKLYWQTYADMQRGVNSYPGAMVVVTGHSLGSSIATLATADLAANNIKTYLYNFASPRTGDEKFSENLNTNPNVLAKWRIVNTEDIVTTVPLATAKVSAGGGESSGRLKPLLLLLNNLNYTHIGYAVNFTAQNNSIVDNHKIETYITALSES